MWFSDNRQKLLSICAALLLASSAFGQDLNTIFYKDFNRWKYDGERFETFFMGSYDQWRFGSLEIRQRYPGNNNEWLIGEEVVLRTAFNNSFNRWEIEGHDLLIRIEQSITHGASEWMLSGDAFGSFSTTFMNDYEHWNFNVDLSVFPRDIQAALVYLAIFASVRNSK